MNPLRDMIRKEIVDPAIRENTWSSIGIIRAHDCAKGLANVEYGDILAQPPISEEYRTFLYGVPVMQTSRQDNVALTGRLCIVDSLTRDGQNWAVVSIFPDQVDMTTGQDYVLPIAPAQSNGPTLSFNSAVASAIIPPQVVTAYMGTYQGGR